MFAIVKHGTSQNWRPIGVRNFLLYLTDLPEAVENSGFILFADDTNLHRESKTLKAIFHKFQNGWHEQIDFDTGKNSSFNLNGTIVFWRKNQMSNTWV